MVEKGILVLTQDKGECISAIMNTKGKTTMLPKKLLTREVSKSNRNL